MTRRSAMGLLGAGGVAGAIVASASSPPAVASVAGVVDPAPGAVPSVLKAGASFGRWVIVEVHEVALGALRVDVRTPGGHPFPLEILARDATASRPPAAVGELAVHVCNGGDGWSPTAEEQGLAAMGLASLLEINGETGHIDGLLTHGARLVAHGDALG